jgi:hypothetical protein
MSFPYTVQTAAPPRIRCPLELTPFQFPDRRPGRLVDTGRWNRSARPTDQPFPPDGRFLRNQRPRSRMTRFTRKQSRCSAETFQTCFAVLIASTIIFCMSSTPRSAFRKMQGLLSGWWNARRGVCPSDFLNRAGVTDKEARGLSVSVEGGCAEWRDSIPQHPVHVWSVQISRFDLRHFGPQKAKVQESRN